MVTHVVKLVSNSLHQKSHNNVKKKAILYRNNNPTGLVRRELGEKNERKSLNLLGICGTLVDASNPTTASVEKLPAKEYKSRLCVVLLLISAVCRSDISRAGHSSYLELIKGRG